MRLETTVAALRSSRAFRWTLGVGVGVIVALGLVLIFLLTQATGNRELYERNYPILFGLNIAVAALLLVVIGWITLRLVLRLRQRKFGSRLLVKLAAIFALVGLFPGVTIYFVSYQFVSRSIESWFDVKVEGALAAGLNLGRVTLDTLAADLGNRTRLAANQLSQSTDASASLVLERLRDQLDAKDVVLWNASGQLIASAGQSRFLLQPDRPSPQQLRAARSKRVMTQIEGLDDAVLISPIATTPQPRTARIKAIALVSDSNFDLTSVERFLQITEDLPTDLVTNAIIVQEANREYQELALARDGLRKMYIGTLTLSLFLAVFGAVLLAVLLGSQLARPLLLLAEGVRQVAQGDLRPKAVLDSNDELGGLTRSFAVMTQQLADARSAVQQSMSQVDAARANLQIILDNLSTGVLVLDIHGHIRTSNPGAARILQAPVADYQGKILSEVPGLEVFGKAVQTQFESYLAENAAHGLEHWQQTFELHGGFSGSDEGAVSLIARGAKMPGTEECLLVFDDVSAMVSTQRADGMAPNHNRTTMTKTAKEDAKKRLAPISGGALFQNCVIKTIVLTK